MTPGRSATPSTHLAECPSVGARYTRQFVTWTRTMPEEMPTMSWAAIPWMARCTRSLGPLYAETGAGAFRLKGVLACGLLSGLLLSPKLWLSDRVYPLSPVSALLPNIPAPLDQLWFGTLLVLLAAIAFTPRSRWLIVLFVCLAGHLSLWDQSR